MALPTVSRCDSQTLRALVLSAGLIVSAGAAAQQGAAPQAAREEDLVEVVIVGSQIRGTKTTEVLPVTVVDKEDIIATAAVSGDDLFRSIPQALLVLANVPFALVGGIAALWVRQLNLNLSASIGFIALFGIAVLNGVVLVEHLNHLRQAHDDEQKSVLDRIVQGAADRLRPVLMTALVASLGFVPMALSTSPGSEVQRPLASVVIGGLITSTVLTLFVLPVLYGWLEQRREARLARRGRAAPAAGLPA